MKKRNLFMSAALMCGFLTIAFRFDSNGIYWLWSDIKPVSIILALTALTFGVLWFKASKRMKIEN
ncbi:MAG TPA: hypothetical protein VMW01_11515 [Williamwhitmania sp.]|nr:hypothetical protein [Williamwhitmania sp.]